VNAIHPKVAYPAVVGLVIIVIMAAVTQYAPHYAPGAALITAVMGLVNYLVGYAAPAVDTNPPPPVTPPAT
jgi:hypothetical protein